MRKDNLQKDFYISVYNAINADYPNKVHSEFIDEVEPKARVFPWITIKTGVDYSNSGMGNVNKMIGTIKVVVYDKGFEDTFIIDTIQEKIKGMSELRIDKARPDSGSLDIDNLKPYYQSLDFEVNVHLNNEAP